MTVVKGLQQSKIMLSAVVILLSMIACEIQVSPPTPSPTPPPSATLHLVATAKATDAQASIDTATVVQATVNLRAEPDGDVIGALAAGDTVVLLSCDGDWCQVEYLEQTGYVFKGCLSVESSLLCQAK